MKKRSKSFLAVLFICLTSTASFAQLSSTKIDSLMQDALQKFKVAGAAIAIVKDGKIISISSLD